MPVNPNEAPEGYEAVESNGCDGECAFEYRSKECLSVACGSCHRKDECCVIFVKKPETDRKEAATKLEAERGSCHRKDECCVIFVKKPARDSFPAQITWPRDSEGREVQE